MNFLAHLYLAGKEEELIVGNFIADSVKGNKYKEYPERIARGLLMHRSIDFFSDTHPAYLKSVHRLAPTYGKFSGVITDMFYDYMLTINWSDYSNEKLEDFCQRMYAILLSHQTRMPEKSKIILTYMTKHNWLLSYARKEGIRRALKGLSERMKYYSPMDEAVSELETNFDSYLADFNEFFPLLQIHAKTFTS